jgi:hypothetical protein
MSAASGSIPALPVPPWWNQVSRQKPHLESIRGAYAQTVPKRLDAVYPTAGERRARTESARSRFGKPLEQAINFCLPLVFAAPEFRVAGLPRMDPKLLPKSKWTDPGAEVAQAISAAVHGVIGPLFVAAYDASLAITHPGGTKDPTFADQNMVVIRVWRVAAVWIEQQGILTVAPEELSQMLANNLTSVRDSVAEEISETTFAVSTNPPHAAGVAIVLETAACDSEPEPLIDSAQEPLIDSAQKADRIIHSAAATVLGRTNPDAVADYTNSVWEILTRRFGGVENRLTQRQARIEAKRAAQNLLRQEVERRKNPFYGVILASENFWAIQEQGRYNTEETAIAHVVIEQFFFEVTRLLNQQEQSAAAVGSSEQLLARDVLKYIDMRQVEALFDGGIGDVRELNKLIKERADELGLVWPSPDSQSRSRPQAVDLVSHRLRIAIAGAREAVEATGADIDAIVSAGSDDATNDEETVINSMHYHHDDTNESDDHK